MANDFVFDALLDKPGPFADVPAESFMGQDKWADLFMKKNLKKIKMNQLRNFFDEIKALKPQGKLGAADKAKLEMNLAYDLGRNVINREFFDVLIKCLNKIRIDNSKDFDHFVAFVRSLIAYHKYHSITQKEA